MEGKKHTVGLLHSDPWTFHPSFKVSRWGSEQG
uniref:Uncharacterized protein n=1 Tax=Anguilla anguilla TaxID=7936 RepID=A0A0E9TDU1_ANGAN